MKKTATYTQCYMTQKPNSVRVGFVPTKFAVRGKVLDLKIEDKWSKGWTVVNTGTSHNAAYLEVHETDYKRQRKGSDV